MNAGDREWDRLIHRHFLGTLQEDEATVLGGALRADPAVRRRLAELAFDEAQIRDLLAGVTASEACPVLSLDEADRAPVPRARWPKGPLVAAAAILLATVTALVVGFLRPPPGMPAAARPSVMDGERIVAAEPRTVKFPDGSRVQLEAGAVAVFRGVSSRDPRRVDLSEGAATFTVRKGTDEFVVVTPLARLTAIGTEFWASLTPPEKKGRRLKVSVRSGRVRVDIQDKAATLEAGQTGSFPPEPAAKDPSSADQAGFRVRGTVVANVDRGFTFRVDEVLGDKDALVGKVLRVGPGRVLDEAGEWVPSKEHVAFVRKVAAGQELVVTLRKHEGGGFILGDLNPDPKGGPLKGVKKEGDTKKREGPKDPPKKTPVEGDKDGPKEKGNDR